MAFGSSRKLRKGLEATEPVVIGVIRDAAFQFYYPENLEALEDRGAVSQGNLQL